MLYTLDSYPPKTNYVCSNTNSTGDLIAFGDEKYNQYLNSGYQFLKYNGGENGSGFVAYKILEDCIEVEEVYCVAPNFNLESIVVLSLLQVLSNDGSALKRSIKYETDDEVFDKIVRQRNQILKEQKVEDKYWWKIK